MTLHPSTFEYLKPSDQQLALMARARTAVAKLATELEAVVPDGPDKTYLLRKVREVGMWSNVAITRLGNGEPRA